MGKGDTDMVGLPTHRAPPCSRWARFLAPFPALTLMLALVLGGCGPSWSPEKPEAGTGGEYRVTPDGYYRVRRGDSLYTISFRYGLDWRDLARWNGIAAPYTIYPDQELRMSPPPSRAARVETRPAPPPGASSTRAGEPRAETRPAPPEADTVPPVSTTTPSATPAPSTPAVTASPEPRPASPPTQSAAPPGRWLWPTEGRVVSNFRANDPARNGIDIGGSEGQPVVAAAAGEVVYSGNGLIGYGELVIIKHDDRRLSAYGHNRRRLVSEGQRVAAGEPLAEMGRNDRNQPMLHFEVRVDGSPQDPLKFLLPR